MKSKPESEILDSILDLASDLHGAGLLKPTTMRQIEGLCLAPLQEFTGAEIRELRERERVSQAVFARLLNVTPGLVSQWERGARRPSGPATRLLTIVHEQGLDAFLPNRFSQLGAERRPASLIGAAKLPEAKAGRVKARKAAGRPD